MSNGFRTCRSTARRSSGAATRSASASTAHGAGRIAAARCTSSAASAGGPRCAPARCPCRAPSAPSAGRRSRRACELWDSISVLLYVRRLTPCPCLRRPCRSPATSVALLHSRQHSFTSPIIKTKTSNYHSSPPPECRLTRRTTTTRSGRRRRLPASRCRRAAAGSCGGGRAQPSSTPSGRGAPACMNAGCTHECRVSGHIVRLDFQQLKRR